MGEAGAGLHYPDSAGEEDDAPVHPCCGSWGPEGFGYGQQVTGGRQRLVYDPDLGIWTCAGCGHGLMEGVLTHHYDCTEVTVPRPGA